MMLVMCRACGEFVTATERDGCVRPVADACPDCGSTEFKHTDTGRTIDTDESRPE